MSLYLEHINQRFGKTQALKDISLEIKTGEFIAILGPSGCGKSTLLRIIGGFLEPMKSRRQKGLSEEEKEKAVEQALESMGLTELADRYPGELSGGQRQRVSLARMMVGLPSLMLMDEPLSALDAELKLSMRRVIQDVHRSTGSTVLYVTHDQSEALAMADRIIVMQNGQIEQVGTPRDIYLHPKTEFVPPL